MKSLSVLFVVLLSSLAIANPDGGDQNDGLMDKGKHDKHGKHGKNKKGGHKMDGEMKQCAKLQHLEHEVRFASNTSRLQQLQDDKKLTAAQVQEIKDKGANASSQVQQIRANQTLAADCDRVAASRKLHHDCHKMKSLQTWLDNSNNQTFVQRIENRFNLTASEVASKKAKNQEKLDALKGNNTLVQACKQFDSGKDGSSSKPGAQAQKGSKSAASSINIPQGATSCVFALAITFAMAVTIF